MPIEIFGHGSSWIRQGDKEGGARGSGDLGGIYLSEERNVTALIKKDPESPNFDIAEYLSSKIFERVAPGYGARVELMVPEGKQDSIPGDGTDVYVRSEFFKDYSDMFKDMDKHLPKEDKPSKFFRKDGRPLMMGARERFSGVLTKAFKKLQYEGFEKTAPGSLLIGDFDIHSGNIGVVRKQGEKPSLKRIDFGWAFAGLTPDVHPHSQSKHLPGTGPTNHFGEFPSSLKLTEEFTKGLDEAANVDLEATLGEAFGELKKFYNEDVLKKWAQHAMPQKFAKKSLEEIKLDDIESSLKETMKSRQDSIREFSLQIKVGLLVQKKGRNHKLDREKLKELVNNNWDYFTEISEGKKQFKFRDRSLRNKKSMKLVMDEIGDLRKEILQERGEIQIDHSKPIKKEKKTLKVKVRKFITKIKQAPLFGKLLRRIQKIREKDRLIKTPAKGVLLRDSSSKTRPIGARHTILSKTLVQSMKEREQLQGSGLRKGAKKPSPTFSKNPRKKQKKRKRFKKVIRI